MKSQLKIVLASTSPQRVSILKNAGFEFEVIPSNYPEIDDPLLSPQEQAKIHAFNKAKSVADRLDFAALVIGCDTVVCLNNKLIGKATDKAHAKKLIQAQQGQTFDVVSGLSIFNTQTSRNITTTVTSQLTFDPISEAEIDWYISTNEWKDKSGAFSVQGIGSRFISNIQGDFHNIVGLPIAKVHQILKQLGY